jgi:hypothetical protein
MSLSVLVLSPSPLTIHLFLILRIARKPGWYLNCSSPIPCILLADSLRGLLEVCLTRVAAYLKCAKDAKIWMHTGQH